MTLDNIALWLTHVTSPEHKKIILNTIELLRQNRGADFEEYIERVLMNFDGKEENDAFVELCNYLADFSRSTIESFGVSLDEDADQSVNQSILNDILFTLTNLLTYEDIRAIYNIANNANSPKEGLFKFIYLLTGRHIVELEPLIDHFSSTTFKRIQEFASEKWLEIEEQQSHEEAIQENAMRTEKQILLNKAIEINEKDDESLQELLEIALTTPEDQYFIKLDEKIHDKLSVIQQAKFWVIALLLLEYRNKGVENTRNYRAELASFLEKRASDFNHLFSLNIQINNLLEDQ